MKRKLSDLKLEGDQVLQATLFLVLQNNIQIRAISQALVEMAALTDEGKANELLATMNESLPEIQEDVIVKLKSMFNDFEDIDLDDLLSNTENGE